MRWVEPLRRYQSLANRLDDAETPLESDALSGFYRPLAELFAWKWLTQVVGGWP